jgi:hypothetical protein
MLSSRACYNTAEQQRIKRTYGHQRTLVDEYLRLAYHGLRAKDKTFNATIKTEFDDTIGMVNVIPQDIGRVILNLITNAFYAVQPLPLNPLKGTCLTHPL